jgi:hypothetical protein
MEEPIVNRVALSQLVTLDLERFHQPGDRVLYDIRDLLFEGLILREKDFRDHVRHHDWAQYKDKLVAITCSADAIVPTWAFMLLTVALQPHARRVFFGTLEEMEAVLFQEALREVNWDQFRDAKVVIKGCGDVHVPPAAYVEATSRLSAVAASVMYGEPCSTVPVFKRAVVPRKA